VAWLIILPASVSFSSISLGVVAGGARMTAEGEDHCSLLKMVVAADRFYCSVGR
jgi:hypothetical protein